MSKESPEVHLPPLQGEGWGGDGFGTAEKRPYFLTHKPHPPPNLPLEGGGVNANRIHAIALSGKPLAQVKIQRQVGALIFLCASAPLRFKWLFRLFYNARTFTVLPFNLPAASFFTASLAMSRAMAT